MKQPAILLSLLLLLPLAQGISLEQAGTICQTYALSSELTQAEELQCAGKIWMCTFRISGEEQPTAVILDDSGETLKPDEERAKIEAIINTKFLLNNNNVLRIPIIDNQFLLKLNDLNSTFDVYKQSITYLYGEGYITADNINEDFEDLQSSLETLLGILSSAKESANDFLSSPDCFEKDSFLISLGNATDAVSNFTVGWIETLEYYNQLLDSIDDVEILIQKASLSNAFQTASSANQSKQLLTSYNENELKNLETVTENMQTRLDRKEAKEIMETASIELQKTPTQSAADKYQEAIDAFNSADYRKATYLAKQTITIIEDYKRRLPNETSENGDTKKLDNNILYLAIVLLAVLVVIVIIYKKKGAPASKEDKEEKERKKEIKELPKSWGWEQKEKKSKLEGN